MPIVASTHVVGHAQADGRRYITEAHTDGAGVVHTVEYLAAPGTNYISVRNERAAAIGNELAEAEARALADNAA